MRFYSEDKLLFGNLHLPRENAPCIVTLHGLESSKDGYKWPIIAKKLYEKGYACLRFSFRGCGEGEEKSEGSFEDTNLTERIKDYKAALKFLENCKVDVNRIGIIGSSFGGMVALASQIERIRALAIISTPYKIPEEIFEEENGFLVLPSRRRLKKSFLEDLRKYDLLEMVRNAPPLLIIHGGKDEIVPVEQAYKLYEHAREPKRLEIFENADHAFTEPKNLDKAIELILEWFEKFL